MRLMIFSRKSGLRCLLSVVMLLPHACCTDVEAADFSVKPFLGVSEEYNDNVFESRDNKKTDYITRAFPGIALKYGTSFWDWDIVYNYDYRYYARHSRDDDNTHYLMGKGLVKVIDDFLLLDINDTYRRVSLDVTRDVTQESLFVNQSDSNIVTASPYFLLHPGPKMTLKTGYRYTNVWYRNPAAIDKREHSGFLDATYEYSSKLSFNAKYTFTHQNSVNAYDKHAPYIGARYEYANKSFIFAQGGYTWIDFKNGSRFNKPYWNAGINHTFDTFSVYFNSGVQFPEDPLSGVTRETDYTLGLNRNMERGSIGFSVYYSKYDGTITDRTKKYGAGVTGRYELTRKLTGSLNFSAEKYDHSTGSYTRRFYVNPSLSYLLPKDITLALNYFFIDYYSPVIFSDNYRVNRVCVEVQKIF